MRIPRAARAGILIMGALLAWPIASASAADRAGATPAGPTNLLPDMIMAKPYGTYVETKANGQVWLRFGTIGWNVGSGPIELVGDKPTPSDQYMTVRQRIYHEGGGSHLRHTAAVMYHDGADGHHHYHVRQFITAVLYNVSDPEDVWGLRKIGFCLLDARRQPNPPPGSPAHMVYPFDSCGDEDSTHLVMGLSIGWGDDYPPAFAHQFINITDLPTGRYRLCLTVDPLTEFREENEDNNQRWVDLRINAAAETANIKASGSVNDPCGPGIP
jgi:hypothetical protein